ncbi:MAG: hypothetical protein COV47_01270, partial [Candidatus Diapherotrites archaeon CG11_big_fil_rev_8_21_14_0_20_37_9]
MRVKFLLLVFVGLVLFSFGAYSASCGDSSCDSGENSCTCPSDCGVCEGEVYGRACANYFCTDSSICSIQVIPNCCGNQSCEESGDYLENYGSCPADCEPKNVNITVISPNANYKARYGEEILFSVFVDADGRGVAGPDVIVKGPFRDFTLFNDGLHDDNRFNDAFHAAYASVLPEFEAGLYDLNFLTSFRGVDGNASMQIEVYPFIDSELFVPAEHEIGNFFDVNGYLSINGVPVSMPFTASIISDLNVVNSQKIVSSEDGSFVFSYRSTLLDSPGLWTFMLFGKDSFGNDLNVSFPVEAFEPGAVKQRSIEFVKEISQIYSFGEGVEIAVLIKDGNIVAADVDSVVAYIGGTKGILNKTGDLFAGTIVVPNNSVENETLVLRAFNSNGGVIAVADAIFDVLKPSLYVEIVRPVDKLLKVGEKVDFVVIVTDSFGSLVGGADVYSLFNGKKLGLSETDKGVFSGVYEI